MTESRRDREILRSWGVNADPWAGAIRDNRIESRQLVTNEAVVSAVMEHTPRTAIDVGCGEGWLARELTARGVDVVGYDAVAGLVERARALGGGDFRQISYEDIGAHGFGAIADVAVANFSLIGLDSVESVVRRVPEALAPGGVFVIQTLHPAFAGGDDPYEDGWRKGSWHGFGPEFSDPAPWYFRTIGSWVALLERSGMSLRDLREPLDPRTGKPASALLIARASGGAPLRAFVLTDQ